MSHISIDVAESCLVDVDYTTQTLYYSSFDQYTNEGIIRTVNYNGNVYRCFLSYYYYPYYCPYYKK